MASKLQLLVLVPYYAAGKTLGPLRHQGSCASASFGEPLALPLNTLYLVALYARYYNNEKVNASTFVEL